MGNILLENSAMLNSQRMKFSELHTRIFIGTIANETFAVDGSYRNFSISAISGYLGCDYWATFSDIDY